MVWGGVPEVLSPMDRKKVKSNLERFCGCDPATDTTVNVEPRVRRIGRCGTLITVIHARCRRCREVRLTSVSDLGLNPKDFDP